MFATALAFVPKPVLLGVLIAFALIAGTKSCTVNKLQKENAAYVVAVEQCVKTNTQNKNAIRTIKLINEQCLDDRRADETNVANQVAAWNAEKALLTEKAAQIEIRNVEVFRDPNCSELAQMDISNICPAFVERLRQRAESYNRIRNGND